MSVNKEQVDFAEWGFGGGDLDNLPRDVYWVFYKAFTDESTLCRFVDFKEGLTATFLDMSSEFTLESVTVLAKGLMDKLLVSLEK